ncbi:MAG: hypothetical protein P1P88_00995 [Bacteroidales bacterium]|nr:hypothetical protein [Bacteroidales bacterium]
MTNENRISLHIKAEDFETIKAATKTIYDTLMPYLVTLTKDERETMLKPGDKSLAFINRCYWHIEQSPKLTAEYINVEEMKVDIQAVETLWKIMNPLTQIVSALNDSTMLSGSEAYVPALAFYSYIKGAARMNVPGAKDIYEDLKKYFIKKPGKKGDSGSK